jgi:putative ABC transport system permease protein
MNLFSLVLVGLGRNKRRTILTFLSVTVALFLFSALGGVLDTLEDSIKVGSETRLITRNAVSLVLALPPAYRERIAAVPGVEAVSYANWFGALDPNDRNGYFAQFAIDADTYLPIYRDEFEIVESSEPQAPVSLPADFPPGLEAFMAEQTACVIGRTLMEKKGWKLGQTITLAGTIFPGDWPFTIRAVYRAKQKSFGEESMLFHWEYLNQKGMGGNGAIGWYLMALSEPGIAADVSKRIDATYENSAAPTRTETEKAFQAGFVSMYGNLPFVIRVIGLAVVFAILLVAANTMVMSFRERTTEFGVLKTLGFADATIFGIVLAEAAIITLGGGLAGTLLAKFALESSGFNFGGFLPPMTIYWTTVVLGVGMALLVGAVSGLVPAWQAARLDIVDALRRVD